MDNLSSDLNQSKFHVAYVTTEFVTDSTFAGGLSNYLFRTCISLQKFNIKTTVILDSTKDEAFYFKEILVLRVKSRKTWWYWLLNLITAFRLNPSLLIINRSYNLNKALKKLHKSDKVDIVQYATTRSVGIINTRIIPSVTRISSYQSLIEHANENRIGFREWQKNKIEDLMLKRAKNLFGPSNVLVSYISKKFEIKVQKIESPFIIDEIEYSNEILNQIKIRTNNSKYILYFGSLSVLKGILEISNIIHDFFKNNPDYFFVFIGKDIPYKGQSLFSLLQEKAGEYKNKVIWYFSLSHKHLYPIIINSTLVVLPSRIDNFPNTCLEAMYFGKIVIGTYGTSFEEIIKNNISGILCKAYNPSSLLESIEFALKLDTKEKEKISKAAKATIEGLRPEIISSKLLNYYKEVIKDSALNSN